MRPEEIRLQCLDLVVRSHPAVPGGGMHAMGMIEMAQELEKYVLEAPEREYVSMHNAAQWVDETCGPIAPMPLPSDVAIRAAYYGPTISHGLSPKLQPVNDPNGGRGR